MEGLEGLFSAEQMRRPGSSSLEQRRLMGDLTALCSLLRRGSEERGADVFSLGPSDRMPRNGSKQH